LKATSAERARIIADLSERGNVGMMLLLMDLEESDDLRSRPEISASQGGRHELSD
jgi:hypothetical protein